LFSPSGETKGESLRGKGQGAKALIWGKGEGNRGDHIRKNRLTGNPSEKDGEKGGKRILEGPSKEMGKRGSWFTKGRVRSSKQTGRGGEKKKTRNSGGVQKTVPQGTGSNFRFLAFLGGEKTEEEKKNRKRALSKEGLHP